MIASGDKRRQVANGGVYEDRRGYKSREAVIKEVTRSGCKRREGAMRVIAPGDKRRQVADGGVYEDRRGYKSREAVIKEVTRSGCKRREGAMRVIAPVHRSLAPSIRNRMSNARWLNSSAVS